MIRPLTDRLLLVCLALALAGCEPESPSGLPTTRMTLGHSTFTLEIAATEASRTKGLMERDSLPANHGMIFIFAQDAPRSFWMYHTRFALDIVFVNSAGRIVSIQTMQPYVTRGTPSNGPAQYAIELNAGQAASSGLHPGQTIVLPAKLPKSD